MNSRKKFDDVVVSAMSATTSIADSLDDTWERLLAGQSGIRILHDPTLEEFALPVRIGGQLLTPPATLLSRVETRRMSYVEQLAVTLSRRLWRDAGEPDVDNYRLGVVIGTGLGGADALVDAVDTMRAKGYRKISPLAVQMTMPNGPAACVGVELGAKAGVSAPVSACASGAEAIAHAWRMIVMDEADIVVAGGVEGRIHAVPIAAFAMMRALSTRNDDPVAASRPFEKDRDGFVFGEAGALMIVERESHARARGAQPIARLVGAATTSDGHSLVPPHPEGEGAARAITGALHRAQLAPRDVDHINAHATSTGIGDLAEAKAIRCAIGTHASVYAPKSALGHSIGAAGALEAVLTVRTLADQVVPPTLNYELPDPGIGYLDIVDTRRHGRIDHAVSNSFGFGGHNVALAFSR